MINCTRVILQSLDFWSPIMGVMIQHNKVYAMNANHILPLFPLFFCLAIAGEAQIQPANSANAAISGRIIIEGQLAQGIEVMLKPSGSQMVDIANAQSPPTVAITDVDGRYRFVSLAAGSYRIMVHAPAYVVQGESLNAFEAGKILIVAESEEIENVDFALRRGGVITGQVADEYGRPVIAIPVNAFRLDMQGKREKTDSLVSVGYETDDRGFFRIFGLEAGRYIVAADASSVQVNLRMGRGGDFKPTYHPDVTDETKARVIEIKSGGEVEAVDIKLARAKKGYVASGLVVETETGKPVPGVMIGYSATKQTTASFGMGNAVTNSVGEFRLEGLSANVYNTFVINLGAGDFYADPFSFEIVGGDVSGLEIKMSRGASISGAAVVEGTHEQAVPWGLSPIQLQAIGDSKAISISGGGTINANGMFRIGGVRPGKNRITANTLMGPKGLSLARVEHNGNEVKHIDVAPGDQITGVRLVFSYGTGEIVGSVEIKGGVLASTARLMIVATRESNSFDDFMNARTAMVDGRGQFLLEGLLQGTYKVRLRVLDASADESVKNQKVEQTVTIAHGARQKLTMVLDLSKKEANNEERQGDEETKR